MNDEIKNLLLIFNCLDTLIFPELLNSYSNFNVMASASLSVMTYNVPQSNEVPHIMKSNVIPDRSSLLRNNSFSWMLGILAN